MVIQAKRSRVIAFVIVLYLLSACASFLLARHDDIRCPQCETACSEAHLREIWGDDWHIGYFLKRGAFKHLMVARPVGRKRYSAALVTDYVTGLSTARFGLGSRRAS